MINLKRLGRYLKKRHALCSCSSNKHPQQVVRLEVHGDSDHAGCLKTPKSTTGMILMRRVTRGVLGLSCGSPGGPVWWGRRGFTRLPKSPNVHILGSRRFKHHQNSTKRPQRAKKNREILGPPPFGAPPFLDPRETPGRPRETSKRGREKMKVKVKGGGGLKGGGGVNPCISLSSNENEYYEIVKCAAIGLGAIHAFKFWHV